MFVEESSRRASVIQQLVVLSLISLTTGCAGQFNNWLHNGFKVGPDYMKPAAQVADEYPTNFKLDSRSTLSDLTPRNADGKRDKDFNFAPDASGLPPTEITDVTNQPHDHSQWWTVFNDPHLNDLIAIASQFGNHDVNAFAGAGSNRPNESLREAALRVLQAREALGIARGNLAPQQQDAFFDYQKRQGSQQTFPTNQAASIFLPKRSHSFWDLGLSAAWELDIWGRFRRAVEAGEAELDFTTEDYDALLVSILADVAQTYYRIRTLQQALSYTKANVVAQKGVLQTAYQRSKGGAENELSMRQAETSLFTTQCLVPEIEQQIQLQKHLLCFLLNRPADPKNIDQLLGNVEPGPGESLIPNPPPHVAVGIPADLMRRRPDLRAVERQLAAQSARIGIAASDLFPTVSILGSVQYEAEFLSDLVRPDSVAGVFGGPAVRWPILNYYRIRNNINVQDAVFQELAARYERTVLQANREVADSIVSFLKFQEQAEYCRRAANAAKRAVDIATVRVDVGETKSLDELFPLQIVKATADNDLARAQGAVIRELIAIYRNLGGGWQIRLNPPPKIQYAEAVEPPAPEDGQPLLPQPPAATAPKNGAPQPPTPAPGNGAAPQPMPNPPADPNGGGPPATMMRILPQQPAHQDRHAWKISAPQTVAPVGHWETQTAIPRR